jgi:membrane protein DedA with SNARE-associated domain
MKPHKINLIWNIIFFGITIFILTKTWNSKEDWKFYVAAVAFILFLIFSIYSIVMQFKRKKRNR